MICDCEGTSQSVQFTNAVWPASILLPTGQSNCRRSAVPRIMFVRAGICGEEVRAVMGNLAAIQVDGEAVLLESVAGIEPCPTRSSTPWPASRTQAWRSVLYRSCAAERSPRNPRVRWQRAGAGAAIIVVAVAFVCAILIRYGPLRGDLSARLSRIASWGIGRPASSDRLLTSRSDTHRPRTSRCAW